MWTSSPAQGRPQARNQSAGQIWPTPSDPAREPEPNTAFDRLRRYVRNHNALPSEVARQVVETVTPLLIDAARPCRHVPGDRWFVDETYVKVAGRWVYLYRAIDQFGQVIDVLVSPKRDLAATRRFFIRALEHGPSPTEVITDKAAVYPPVLDEIAPGAWHHTERYANNRIESDHSRLKSRLQPMRGLKQLRCTQVISPGHAFIQNLHRGHYELGTEETVNLRFLAAFDELTLAI